ncbi:hypothetical protein NLI96_g5106 [Meripilus lineatus]|uniref:MARVEL domain-containing protein n=1 Tax=Meripilus lineatus TaxID=2056292 RepID=A0AAD5V407_9APHY|nr:hypothetical protein NLI96_g5106 [Physisporinus lineatus]
MSRFDTATRRGHPITFGLIIVFATIELAISAWLVAKYEAHNNYPSIGVRDRTRFLLFTSSWTIFFSMFYLILFLHSASTGSIMTSVASHLLFLVPTWIFWVSGAAAITAALGGGLDCGTTDDVYCGQLNALEGFAWINWILVTFAFIVVIIRGISASRRGDGMRGQLVAGASTV